MTNRRGLPLYLSLSAGILALVAWMALAVPSARAQTTAKVVTTCPGSSVYTAGQFGYPTIDVTGAACGVSSGSSGGTSSSFGSAFPATGTAIGVKNGANMVNLTADGSNNLDVNCAVGCAGGSTSNASSGVATSSTNGASVSWLYGFNGTTWDQIQVDGSKFLKTVVSAALPAGTNLLGKVGIDQTTPGTTNGVQVNAALPAGTNVIGHVIADSGSTTAVTGSVAVTGTFWQLTQPVSGSVTANAGTNLNTSALALDTSVNGLLLGQNSTTAAQSGPLVQGAVTTSSPSYTTAKTSPLSLDANGGLRVDVISGSAGNAAAGATGSAVPAQAGYTGLNFGGNLKGWVGDTNGYGDVNVMNSPAVTGSGNFTVVQPTGTNLHAVLDTTSTTAVTQATAANLNATVIGAGSAGTANAGVVTVQGIASMTKLLVTPDSVALPANQSVNTAQVNGVTTLAGAGATGTGAQRETVSQDTTTIAGSAPGTAGSASANVVTVQGVASMTKLLVTPDSVALPANQSVNVSQINAVTPLMGNGTTGTGSQRVTIASDNTAFSVNAQPTAATTGGASIFTKQVANNTTSFAVDASAGTLYGVFVQNNSANIAYLKLYNTAQGSVTCGTPTPVDRIMIPANASGAGAVIMFPVGVAYGTAITACVTTGFADNDTTAPAASAYQISFYYK